MNILTFLTGFYGRRWTATPLLPANETGSAVCMNVFVGVAFATLFMLDKQNLLYRTQKVNRFQMAYIAP